jgi:hypothetical protein
MKARRQVNGASNESAEERAAEMTDGFVPQTAEGRRALRRVIDEAVRQLVRKMHKTRPGERIQRQ